MTDLMCHCMGVDHRSPCEHQATQEDGLCDVCRCPHGDCAAHWPDEISHESYWEDPDVWMEGFSRAYLAKGDCLMGQNQ